MAAKKKAPAKKKPAFKKKPSKPASKSAAGKSSNKKSFGKRKTSAKVKAKAGARRPVLKSKRPSPRRKVAPKKGATKAPKAKIVVHDAPEALALARSIAQVAVEKKAAHVVIIDVRVRSSAVGYDYIVLASGESDRQLSAIHEGVDELLKPQGKKAAVVEASSDWVCVTYDEGVMAHFFTPDRREQMDIEGIWSDEPRVSA